MPAWREITEEDLGGLGSGEFVDAMNGLLKHEAARVGIPWSALDLSCRVNDPDGGIDARLPGAEGSELIPDCPSVWQFKSVRRFDRGCLRREFGKPRVQECLDEGGTYRLVLSRGVGRQGLEARRADLGRLCEDAGREPTKGVILGAGEIALAMCEHPALLLLRQFRPQTGMMSLRDWERTFEFEYVGDDARGRITEEVRRCIETEGTPHHIRIEGDPGVGKSRLVLEALRPEKLAALVLYSPGLDPGLPEALAWLRDNPGRQAIVVVDDVGPPEAQRVADLAGAAAARVTVITVGAYSAMSEVGHRVALHRLEPLGGGQRGRVCGEVLGSGSVG